MGGGLAAPDPRPDRADQGSEQHRYEAVDETVLAREPEQGRIHAAPDERERLFGFADALAIAEGTVKNYVSSVLAKMGVRDRTRAVLKAIESGLL